MPNRILDLFDPARVVPDLESRVHGMIRDFLAEKDVSSAISLADLAREFEDVQVPEVGTSEERYFEALTGHVVAHSVHTASPRCMAHMTTGVPHFLRPLGALLMAMNQNMVKADASRVLTLCERQALAMLHRALFGSDAAFYQRHAQDVEASLGIMVSGGTLANITALWIARNAARRAGGGGPKPEVVIGSRLMHYSFAKGMDLLGLGEENLVLVEVDTNNRISLPALREVLARVCARGQRPLALVGIAGTTDAGSIDPLDALADLAAEHGAHFHVDAAWGGTLCFSRRHAARLKGIERADSVTLDGHKRFFLPTGTAMVMLRDPALARCIERSSPYIIRAGSPDLGRRALEGSRPGTALYLHAALQILGREGYEQIVDDSLALTSAMAELVRGRDEFELLAEPEVNIVLYRYLPRALRSRARAGALDAQDRAAIDQVNERLHRAQRAAGHALVSRTTLHGPQGERVALRAVLSNPLTRLEDVRAVLEEQVAIGALLEASATDAGSRAEPLEPVPVRFERQVRRTPAAVAVWDEGRPVTYAEVDESAEGIARALRQLELRPGESVGLALQRSWRAIAAVLGIWKAGGAFLPLTPESPPRRLAEIIAAARLRAIVTDGGSASRMPPSEARQIRVDALVSEAGAGEAAGAAEIRLDQPAFVLFTSGSTGEPKGVVGLHRTVANRLAWEPHPFEPGEVFAQRVGLSFIDFMWESFAPLTRGLSAVVVPAGLERDTRGFVDLLARHRVTRLILPPSYLRGLVEAEPDLASRLPDLKYWVSTGEPLPTFVAERFLAALPDRHLLNIYGTTEVWDAACFRVAAPLPDGYYVPIGRPMHGVELHLLDEQRRTVELGALGELYVSGAGVAAGYLHREELTRQRFQRDEATGTTLYKTGDLARLLPSGDLEVVGRADHQVKIRGFRVELGEIDAMLGQHPDVAAAVTVADKVGGATRLVAYVVPRPGAAVTPDSVARFLGGRLEAFKQPSAIIPLERMPMTPSGKVDRRALPPPPWARPEATGDVEAPRTEAEALLVRLWREVLELERVAPDDNFLALGGNSIAAAVVSARAGRAGLPLKPQALLGARTLAEMAAEAAAAAAAAPSGAGPASLHSAPAGTASSPGAPAAVVPASRSGATATDGAPDAAAHSAPGPESPAPVAGVVATSPGAAPAAAAVAPGDGAWSRAPLTANQRFMLDTALKSTEPHVFLVDNVWELSGRVDPDRFAKALGALVQCEPLLRTSFEWGSGEPMQIVAPEARVRLTVEDASTEPASTRERRVEDLLAARRAEPFDLRTAPLLHAALVRLDEDRWRLWYAYHHLIADQWSELLLLRDLLAAYDGKPIPVRERRPFSDYVSWTKQVPPAEGEQFFRAHFHGFSWPSAVTAFLKAVGPGRRPSNERRALHFELPEILVERIEAEARRRRIPSSAFVFGAAAVAQGAVLGLDDVVVSTTVSGRWGGLAGMDEMVGPLLGILPMRVGLAARPLDEWLGQVRDSLIGLQSHAHHAAHVAPWCGWRGPSLPAWMTLVMENFAPELARLDNGSLRIHDLRAHSWSPTPLLLMLHPGTSWRIDLFYDPGWMDETLVARIEAGFESALTALAGGVATTEELIAATRSAIAAPSAA